MSFYRMLFSTLILGALIITGCDSAGDNVEDEPEPEPTLAIRLVGQLSIPNENPNAIHSDVWGYVDANTGKEILTLKGHDRPVTSVVFSPNGQSVLTGSRDGTAIIWPAVDWRKSRLDERE